MTDETGKKIRIIHLSFDQSASLTPDHAAVLQSANNVLAKNTDFSTYLLLRVLDHLLHRYGPSAGYLLGADDVYKDRSSWKQYLEKPGQIIDSYAAPAIAKSYFEQAAASLDKVTRRLRNFDPIKHGEQDPVRAFTLAINPANAALSFAHLCRESLDSLKYDNEGQVHVQKWLNPFRLAYFLSHYVPLMVQNMTTVSPKNFALSISRLNKENRAVIDVANDDLTLEDASPDDIRLALHALHDLGITCRIIANDHSTMRKMDRCPNLQDDLEGLACLLGAFAPYWTPSRPGRHEAEIIQFPRP